MLTPTSKVRKAFFGVWIAAAVMLFVVGRVGGAFDGVTAPRLAPADADASSPAMIVSREAAGR